MKTSSVTRNLMMGVFILLAATEMVYARGNFIPYPINCTAIDRLNRSIEIQIYIQNNNGAITGYLMDNGDLASVRCQEVATNLSGFNYLECVGRWKKDGSEARVSTPLITYTPIVTVQRSSSALGSKVAQGVCITW